MNAGCISLIGFSERLNLFVDIEGNTRRIANLLDKEEVKKEECRFTQARAGVVSRKGYNVTIKILTFFDGGNTFKLDTTKLRKYHVVIADLG